MKITWTKHLKDPEEQENFKKFVKSSAPVLDILSQIVYNKGVEKQKSISIDYSSASWAYEQAHVNGYLEAVDMIIDLLDLKEK